MKENNISIGSVVLVPESDEILRNERRGIVRKIDQDIAIVIMIDGSIKYVPVNNLKVVTHAVVEAVTKRKIVALLKSNHAEKIKTIH